jgi:hypothetical protein
MQGYRHKTSMVLLLDIPTANAKLFSQVDVSHANC